MMGKADKKKTPLRCTRLMIFDDKAHVGLYYHLSNALKDSFDFLRDNTFCFENPHACDIGTTGIYALPQQYSPTKKEERSIEAHQRYIDIQVMLDGVEYLGFSQKDTLHSLGYDEDHDFEQLTGTLSFLPFRTENFAVLFPHDAHMPGVNGPGSTKTVKKIVIKVPIERWK